MKKMDVNPLEEIQDFPEQDTFNTDDMTAVNEEGEE